MADLWVINASPLILLGKVGLLDLLSSLGKDLVVPGAVRDEVLAGPQHDLAAHRLRGEGIGRFVEVERIAPAVEPWDLGPGESEVLTIAVQQEAEAILDDRAARRCANALGVPCRGTLGVLLFAKHAGWIDDVGSVVAQLREAGLRLDDAVESAVRRLAGEP